MELNKMNGLTFNKSLTNQRASNNPSVSFRKLAETGNSDRYQGSLNTSAYRLLKEMNPLYTSIDIVFSDDHSIIGFKPLDDDSGYKPTFGATQLFKNLNLAVGKKYTLKIQGDYAVIDSEEFNK